jgi:hypothetical protein
MTQDWNSLKDEELLKLRICDLSVRIEGSEIQDRISALHQELQSRGLRFSPKIYLGDEWFSPEGMVAISVPFYLAHPRLVALEKRLMLEVEGGTPEWFMKLLRHEAGHCFDHAYRFSKQKRWREIFGSPDQEYHPETYRPRPYSKSFVRHIPNWYAQSHPDEDFAETFAVWLTPSINWREEYADWPVALRKLEYVDEQVRRVANRAPGGEKGTLPFEARRMKTTLEKYYARRRKENAEDYPDFFDPDLRRIFSGSSRFPSLDLSAGRFMRRNRKLIIDSVSHWTGEKKFTVSTLVRKLVDRCDNLDLWIGTDETRTHLEVAAYLATLVTHHQFTGRFKRSV